MYTVQGNSLIHFRFLASRGAWDRLVAFVPFISAVRSVRARLNPCSAEIAALEGARDTASDDAAAARAEAANLREKLRAAEAESAAAAEAAATAQQSAAAAEERSSRLREKAEALQQQLAAAEEATAAARKQIEDGGTNVARSAGEVRRMSGSIRRVKNI